MGPQQRDFWSSWKRSSSWTGCWLQGFCLKSCIKLHIVYGCWYLSFILKEKNTLKINENGISLMFQGYDSSLPLQEAQVWSLVTVLEIPQASQCSQKQTKNNEKGAVTIWTLEFWRFRGCIWRRECWRPQLGWLGLDHLWLEGARSWGNFWALSLEIRTRVDKEEDEGQEGERCVISEGSPPELVKDSSKVSQNESPQTLTSQRPSLGPGPPDRSSGP